MLLKHKIILLTVLPLIVALSAIAGIVAYQSRLLATEQADVIKQSLLASKRAELQHYVGLALTSIDHLYSAGRDDEGAKNQAKRILREMNYGDDGYFFAYDLAGNNLVHPRKPELVGRNLWDFTDPSGRPVIQRLIRAARDGDGFERYQWEKPSNRQMSEKLGYVVMLDRWGWMMGTGIYLDDLDQATQKSREEVAASIGATMLALAAVAVVAALLVFGGGLALNVSEHRLADAKLKQLAQDIVRLQEVERARVSRELHDGISQVLVSIKFRFELAQEKLLRGAGDPQPELAKGISGLVDAIAEIRRISHDLRPSLLDDLGLASAIKQLAGDFSIRTGIAAQVDIERYEGPVGGEEAVSLFRIAQEAMTNIERHAAASEVSIVLEHRDASMHMQIEDNGRGFDTGLIDHAANRGIGLRNIRERIEHLGGTLVVDSRAGRTNVSVRLPAPEQPASAAS